MEGTIAEIRMFAGTFAPRTWAFCQNQTIAIAQNTALFSLLGTTYGGNGQTTFALPDFRGRIPVGAGTGPGLSNYQLGQKGGSESFTITNANFPPHTHPLTGSIIMKGNAADGDADVPQNNYPAALAGTDMYSTVNNGSALANMPTQLTAAAAGSASPAPVTNIQPVMGMNYIICMFGIFPARN
jgi:microcystin-dependent protein